MQDVEVQNERKMFMESKKQEVPIWEKACLTIDEASKYSNIGINKIQELARNPRNRFVLNVGNKKLIKRKEFEQFITNNIEI